MVLFLQVKTLYFYGPSNTGKNMISEIIASPMMSTALCTSNKGFSFAPLKRPINCIFNHEWTPETMQIEDCKKLWGGEVKKNFTFLVLLEYFCWSVGWLVGWSVGPPLNTKTRQISTIRQFDSYHTFFLHRNLSAMRNSSRVSPTSPAIHSSSRAIILQTTLVKVRSMHKRSATEAVNFLSMQRWLTPLRSSTNAAQGVKQPSKNRTSTSYRRSCAVYLSNILMTILYLD